MEDYQTLQELRRIHAAISNKTHGFIALLLLLLLLKSCGIADDLSQIKESLKTIQMEDKR